MFRRSAISHLRASKIGWFGRTTSLDQADSQPSGTSPEHSLHERRRQSSSAEKDSRTQRRISHQESIQRPHGSQDAINGLSALDIVREPVGLPVPHSSLEGQRILLVQIDI
jgi:hypothetical protein